MIIYQITRTLAGGEVEAVWLPLQRLLEELLEAGGQAAQVQLLAPAHQLQHLIPQLLVGALPLCIEIYIHSVYFVKLREREGQGVDPGRSLKGHL